MQGWLGCIHLYIFSGSSPIYLIAYTCMNFSFAPYSNTSQSSYNRPSPDLLFLLSIPTSHARFVKLWLARMMSWPITWNIYITRRVRLCHTYIWNDDLPVQNDLRRYIGKASIHLPATTTWTTSFLLYLKPPTVYVYTPISPSSQPESS